ncbi:M23 family metallopeptidase [Lysinibacter cavernae]|uniref:Murein DD-endopeptidase MepM/ murein hydrolase activator NlpD n=1 Tax=Lysinibacter cavernae TaxID=1640652 RepID=A0A7X5R189_9MICO|nr:M23 family metallopeptidase [Lysinibacter cavernae]NIH53743.1 murein DD-endopeptidase MepM/ murein hydrolase activator NlpD [Lysinibacter cavernae]
MTIQWPVDAITISQQFGANPAYYQALGQRGHNGIDLAVPAGTPVYATDAGDVDAEGWGKNDSWMGTPAGIFVRLRHPWGFSAVAHLSSTAVDRGQAVARGERIGWSGATGQATGPHVHFEVFPTTPNWGNGYAGRVNPSGMGIVARGSVSAPQPTSPAQPGITLGAYEMIRIQSPGRGIALIGAGYFRKLHTTEEVEQSAAIIAKHVNGNDRQFDLWRSMAVGGERAKG